MTRRRPLLPWVVWGAAVAAYVVAIINRSSLAALGPTTQEHFGIDATALASFAVIQLIVYAAMQIPVGMLLDRYGPTVLILTGGVLMALGQVAMATVHDVSLAILARVLIGAGDACTFISVIRLLPEWFSVRQLPTLSQLTGLLGQAGQLVSVTPLALLVGAVGWTNGFLGVAAVCVFVALIGVFTIRDTPGMGTMFERVTGKTWRVSREAQSLGVSDSTTALLAVAPPDTSMFPAVESKRKPGRKGFGVIRGGRRLLSVPGVRLAYWVHFTTPFPTTMLVMLWGTPFFTGGVGLSQAETSWLLSLVVISNMVVGLVMGPIASRFARHRVMVNVVTAVMLITMWSLVLLWPGVPPMWLLVTLVLVVPIGGPTSMMAFEVSRTHAPKSLSGVATGFVNTGGFTAALIAIFLVGLVLDLQGAGSPENYSLDAFKWAFATQLPILALGAIMMTIELRRTGRWMREHGRTLG